MISALLDGLDSIAHGARLLALGLFLLANLVFVGGLLLRREQRYVNRWTSHWLAANLVALSLGAGVPLATGLVRMALAAVPDRPTIPTSIK
jgi:hypothetical protein